MLDLILFPFQLVWGLLQGLFGLISGLLGAVFGILGGVFGLVFGIAGLVIKLSIIGLLIGAVVEFIRRHRARSNEPAQDEFVSYYDKDAVR